MLTNMRRISNLVMVAAAVWTQEDILFVLSLIVTICSLIVEYIRLREKGIKNP